MTDDDAAIALAHQMFDMAREGRTEELSALLDAGAPVDLTNAGGDTLLILAAYHQNEGTVRALLDRGADVGRLNDRSQNALTCAVFRQEASIVRMLLDAGAPPDDGRPSARATAQYFGLPDMTALLERRG
ncbi:ankyrin repeat domain-containing protein [Georgenia sp. SUBG003]|uniref:ankyrin repeat domain-containing protein n=1 Tax=Georgenia sp. SUBG003 TaxID=1497974 RepID=UPI0004D92787|nr:ankyrin [Georgenia sp. SUBG003]